MKVVALVPSGLTKAGFFSVICRCVFIVLLLAGFSQAAFAQTADMPAGSGTITDPYRIATLNNLYWVTQNPDSWDATFKQTNNIDASSTTGWDGGAGFSPIGNSDNPFKGNYFGDSHTITGLSINRGRSDFIGMFGEVHNAKIIKLGLIDVSIDGDSGVGGLVGRAEQNYYPQISNCFVTGNVSGSIAVGGLAGSTGSIIMKNSYTTASVTARAYPAFDHIGGLIGSFHSGSVTNSYSTGSVNTDDTNEDYFQNEEHYGGLIGSAWSGVSITNSYWDVQTSGISRSNGGTGLTSTEMKQQGSFSDWDFENTWDIDPSSNNGYPTLIFLPNEAPAATNVSVSGTLGYEGVLTATYDFSDNDSGDSDEGANYRWVRYSNGSGSDATTISDERSSTYTVTLQDLGKFIRVAVVPFDGEAYGDTVWSEYKEIEVLYAGGDGTEASPFEISSASELNNVRRAGNAYFKLTSDIDLSSFSNWEPINSFSGHFDGNGYTISNLTINRSGDADVGLFGHGGGTLVQIALEDVSVTGGHKTGGVYGFLEDGSVSESYTTGSINGKTNTGGFIGYAKNSTISNSYSLASVNAGSFETVGGLVGQNQAGSVVNSYAAGLVSGTGNQVGGLIGLSSGESSTSGSYWDEQTTDRTDSNGGTGRSTFEMKFQTGYSDWDFTDIWSIESGTSISYPYLRNTEPEEKPGEQILFEGGEGTESNPYQIAKSLAIYAIRYDLDAHYQLTSSIDLSTFSNWEPINNFSGNIDGAGYTISGLTIDRSSTENIGLFGYGSGTLSKIALVEVSVTGGSNTGALYGYMTGGSISESYSSGSITGGENTGGLVGQLRGSISNSYSLVSVDGGSSNNIGGLVGINYQGSISRSYAAGSVSGSGTRVLGLVGYESGGSTSESYWDTETSGKSGSYGGTAKTTEEMKGQSTFTNWDFANTWNIIDGAQSSYPYLINNEPDDKPGFESNFEGGTGTQSDPYLITTPAALNSMREELDAYYKLTADINLDVSPYNEGNGWEPIGTNSAGQEFSGELNGNGYSITNLFISRNTTSFVGLFGATKNAVIKNIAFEEVDITGQNYVGVAVGINYGTIRESYTTGSVSGDSHIGGIVGANETWEGSPGEIKNAYSLVDVSSTGDNSGGIIGRFISGEVLNVYASGEVNGTNEMGGLAGVKEGGTLTSGYWNSDVFSSDNGVGVGKTSSELQDQNTFTGWDFSNPWNILSGGSLSFPYLKDISPSEKPGETTGFAGGTGTESDPYQIANASTLNSIRENTSAHYILVADIDLDEAPYNQGSGWDPIDSFSGSLNGDGYIISNLFIDRDEGNVGFFSSNSGTLSNIGLERVNIQGGTSVGSLVGDNSGTISGCYATGQVTGTQLIGGLVSSNGGTIQASYASVTANAQLRIAGGLVGMNEGNIQNSYANGKTISNAGIGGLIGRVGVGNSITLSFWNSDSTSVDNGAGTGKTTAELQDQSTFSGWDFSANWNSSSSEPPMLQIFNKNAAPVASNVTVTGSTQVDAALTGSYSYSDSESEEESGSTYKWYTATDTTGAKTLISGATDTTYTLTDSEEGKYIQFEVTPNDGNTAGSSYVSAWAGPVEGTERPVFNTGENKAISFNNNGYISLDGQTEISASSTNDNFSISMWIKTTATDQALFGEFKQGSSHTRNYLTINGSGQLSVDQWEPSGGTTSFDTAVNTGEWVHVVYVQDSGTRKAYVNGTLEASTGSTEAYSGDNPDLFYLGYRGGSSSGNNFNGEMDEVSWWSKALSSSEISDLYDGTIDQEDANLLGYLSFDSSESANITADVGDADGNMVSGMDADDRVAGPELDKPLTVTVLSNVASGTVISDSVIHTPENTPSFEVTDADGGPFSLNNEGKFMLTRDLSEADTGFYTVSFEVTLEGVEYTSEAEIRVVLEDEGSSEEITSMIGIPAQDGSYNGARGLWFVAPKSLIITGLRVPTDANSDAQSVQVLKISGGESLMNDSGNFETLAYHRNISGTDIIEVNILVHAGDSVGILGTRGVTTSYGPSPHSTTILGESVQLYRINSSSGHISSSPATSIRLFNEFQLGRTEIYYKPADLPVASEVDISGLLKTGEQISGVYEYSHPKGFAESGTTFKWYSASDTSGSKTEINGATDSTYTLTTSEANKFIQFEVVPDDGINEGVPSRSKWVGPVILIDPPSINSITRQSPSEESLENPEQVTFRVVFNKPVANVDTSDFEITGSVFAELGSVSMVSDSVYDVVIADIGNENGTLGLAIKGTGSTSGSNNIVGVVNLIRATARESRTDDWLNQSTLGQSFKAGTSNKLNSVTVFTKSGDHNFSGTATLTIYSGTYDEGGTSELASQTITIANTSGAQTFVIIEKPQLTQGETYSFVLSDFSGSGYALEAYRNSGYANGQAYFTGMNSTHKETFDLKFEIKEDGIQETGSLLNTAPETSESYTVEVNSLPVASNVSITGTLAVGDTLVVSYDFSDSDTDSNHGADFQWYRADDNSGTNQTLISGATDSTYIVSGNDTGKYLRVGVSAYDGITYADSVPSDFVHIEALFANGSGTEEDPYQISTVVELNKVRHTLSSHFILTADIDLNIDPFNSGDGWEPIGNSVNKFTGNFNGALHTVANLYIDRSETDYVGLFGYISSEGRVDSLKLRAVDITGKDRVGGISGMNEGVVTYSYAEGSVGGVENVGGLVGLNQGSITQSFTYGEVDGTKHVGGLAGYNYWRGDGAVSHSYSLAEVHGEERIGGLIGEHQGTLSSSYAAGSVTTDIETSLIGGLVGNSDGNINNSFWDTINNVFSNNRGGTETSSALMRTESNFTDAGWDFDSTWTTEVGVNDGYPYLQGLTPPPVNNSPVASNAFISGNLVIDSVLTAKYDYSDFDDDAESGSSFKWFAVYDTTGSKTEVSGATDSTFTLTSSENAKYIQFEVSPKDGSKKGVSVSSAWVGPVMQYSPPMVTSIARYSPSSELLEEEDQVLFSVIFDKPVMNVDTTDFEITGSVLATIDSVSAVSDSVYYVAVSNIEGTNGAFGISVKGTGSTGGSNNITSFARNDIPTVSQLSTNDWLGQSELGQSFKAGTSGILKSVTIYKKSGNHSFNGTATLTIYSGTYDEGSTSELTSQTVNITDEIGAQTITIADKPDLEAGETYSFVLSDFSGSGYALEAYTGSGYANGQVYFTNMNESSHKTDFDLRFRVTEETLASTGDLLSNAPEISETYRVGHNATPVASNVSVTGSLNIDSTLAVGYDFSDDDGDQNGGAKFQWYHSDDDSGTNESSINNAEDSTYTINAVDAGKYLRVAVIPFDGTAYGDTVWSSYKEMPDISTLFAGGAGTPEDPYQITTPQELNNIRYALDTHYELQNDIDLDVAPYNEGEGWEPIGAPWPNYFTGSLDGNARAVSGLYINRSSGSYQGLFGVVDNAEITGLTLSEVDITGNGYVGALVGELNGTGSEISYVQISGAVSGNSEYVGGLVGYQNEGSITKVVTGGTVGGGNYTSGLVGLQSNGSIDQAFTNVVVSGSEGNDGGLLAYSPGGFVTNSFWNTDSTATSEAGTGLTTAQINNQTNYTDAGWDFGNTWYISESGTPDLIAFTGNTRPVVSNVYVSGALNFGERLLAQYVFSDGEGDEESGSVYAWYTASDTAGTKSQISGATDTSLVVSASEVGKYIQFVITPKDGLMSGEQVESNWVGPVKSTFHVLSMVKQEPVNELTNSDSVVFRVSFNKNLGQITTSDFAVSGTAGNDGTVAAVRSVSDSLYDVKVTGLSSSNGSINLDIKGLDAGESNAITSTAGEPLSDTLATIDESYLIDTISPSRTGGSIEGKTYGLAQNMDVIVVFNDNVVVDTTSGVPSYSIAMGGQSRTAYFVSGSGTNKLTFRYTTVAGDLDGNGITILNFQENGGHLADSAGNSASMNGSFSGQAGVRVDTQQPRLSISSAQGLVSGAFTATFSFTKDVSGFELDDIAVGNGVASSFDTTNARVYTALITPENDGEVTVYVDSAAAFDIAGNGNTAVSQLSVTNDESAPDVPVFTNIIDDTGNSDDRITSDQTLAFSGTAQPNVSLEVFLGETSIGTTTVNSEGNWQLDYTGTALDEGIYAVTVKAIDDAGNESEASEAIEVIVDLTPPSVPVISGISEDTGDSDEDQLTKVTNLTFYGTADSSSTIELFIGETSIGTTTVDSVGDWSFDHTAIALDEGTYSIAAKAGDEAGNYSDASTVLDLEIDLTAPPVPSVGAVGNDTGESNSDFITNDQSLIIGGLAQASTPVEVFIDGVSIGTTTTNAQGTWLFDYNGTNLDEGEYVITSKTFDAAGNKSSASATQTLIIDLTSPEAPVVAGIVTGGGAPNPNGTTTDSTLVFGGTAEANSEVEVFINNSGIGTVTADSDGNWEFDHTGTSLSESTYSITAKAKDIAGNISSSSNSFVLAIDYSAPEVPFISGIIDDTGNADDGITTDQTLKFAGTAQANDSLEVFLDVVSIGKVKVGEDGNWEFDHSSIALTEGSYTITVQAFDDAGNTSELSNAFEIEVDLTAPSVPVIAGISEDSGDSDKDNLTNATNLTFLGTADSSSTIELFIGEESIGTTTSDSSGNWSFDHTAITLDEGNHSVIAKAGDTAGNVSEASSALDLEIDITAPPVPSVGAVGNDTGNSNSDFITNDQSLVIGGLAQASIPVEVFIDGVSIGTATTNAQGTWLFDYTGTNLDEGSYTISAKTFDTAGNKSAASEEQELTIDITSPEAPTVLAVSDDTGDSDTDFITEDQTLIISGSAAANDSVDVYLDGEHIASVLADGSGLWTMDHTAATLDGGEYILKARVQDMAGNTSDFSTGKTLTIDLNSAPVISSLKLIGNTYLGENLTAQYIYNDTNNDEESGTTFKWYISADTSGAKTRISGEISSVYSIADSDEGKFIQVVVSPNDGTVFGDSANSSWVGPIQQPRPEIVVTGNGIEIAKGDDSPTDSDSTFVGIASVADSVISVTYQIKNVGDTDLVLGKNPVNLIGINASDFMVLVQPDSAIAHGDSTSFTINFDPSDAGNREAEVQISSNDSDENLFTFAVEGTGNAAPQITGSVTNQQTEEDTPIAPFSAITLADTEDDNISVEVTLDENMKGLLIGGGFAGIGPYTLSSQSVANAQEALRSLEFDPSDNRVFTGDTETTTFYIRVSDNWGTYVDSVTTVISTAINDAPVATISGGITVFAEGSGSVVIDDGVRISDSDNTSFFFSEIRISAGFKMNEDILGFTNDGSTMGNIQAEYNQTTGVLTLSSADTSATAVEFQSALRAVTYDNTSQAPNTENRTISFTINDGLDSSTAGTQTISLTDTNNAPVASTVAISGSLKVDSTLTASYSFSDAEGDKESGSTYKWYIANDTTEAGVQISGAADSTYTLTAAEKDKYIQFEVTPNDGTEAGVSVESSWYGPVYIPLWVEGVAASPDTAKKIAIDSVLTINFNQTITEENVSGISISSSSGSMVSGVNASVTDSAIVITHDDFEPGIIYIVEVPAEAISIGNGETNETINWTFRSLLSAPEIISIFPPDGTKGVFPTAQLYYTFDQEISISDTDGIKIIDSEGKSASGLSSHVQDEDLFKLQVDYSDLEHETSYTAIIPPGVVRNEDDIVNADSIITSFVTRKGPLVMENILPADESTSIGIDSTISVKFNYDIEAFTNISDITLKDAEGTPVENTSATISDSSIVISHDALDYASEYTVMIPGNAITNGAYHNDEVSWSFTTVQAQPVVEALYPEANAVGVALDSVIAIIFDKEITEENLSGITIQDTTGTSISNVEAMLSDRTITISHNDFSSFKKYIVTIPAGAVENEDGLPNEEVTWSFNTLNSLPVAENVIISGTLHVDSTLTVSYNFGDADGDTESGSTYQWHIADDNSGTEAVPINGAVDTVYTLTSSENGKYIRFEVIPNDGNEVGEATQTAWQGPITTPSSQIVVKGNGIEITNDDNTPAAKDSTFFGVVALVDSAVSVTYYIHNIGNDVLETGENAVSVSGAVASDFTVIVQPDSEIAPGDSSSFTIRFDPSDVDARTAQVSITHNGLDANPFTFTINGTGVSRIPIASNASISGNLTTGQVLTGNYIYISEIEEEDSFYEWYSAEDSTGSNASLIDGAVGTDFTLANAQIGKYIRFEVTPAHAYAEGSAATSDWIGPVNDLLLVDKFTPQNDAVNVTTESVLSVKFNQAIREVDFSGITIKNSQNVEVQNVSASISDSILSITHDELAYEEVYTVNLPANAVVSNSKDNSSALSWSFTTENFVPVASDVTIEGILHVGKSLQASYTYFDKGGNTEAGSTYKWFVADDSSGSNAILISNATATNYMLTANESGKFIGFEVVPNDGVDAGKSYKSTWLGPVITPEPEILVLGNENGILSGDDSPSMSDSTDFGKISIADTSAIRIFNIVNTGIDTLVLGENAVSINGTQVVGFSISVQPEALVLPDDTTTFALRFDPSDSGIHKVTVNIANNDPDESPYLFDVQGIGENTAPIITSISLVNIEENNTDVVTVTATDKETPAALTFSIIGGVDQNAFSINEAGILSFKVAPDFENAHDLNKNNVYELTVQVSDGDSTASQNIEIVITDANETAPEFTSVDAVTINENATTVLTVSATDADTSDTISYFINDGADAAHFTINANSGVLSFLSAPDFESPQDANGDHIYEVAVLASDEENTTSQSLEITIEDVNEFAPVFISAPNAKVYEQPEVGTLIAIIAAEDKDSTALLSFGISSNINPNGNGKDAFALDAETGALTVADPDDFNKGENPSFSVEIMVSDGDSSAVQVLNIAVASAPVVVKTSPENEALAIALDASIEIHFDQKVKDIDLAQVQIIDEDENSVNNIETNLTDSVLAISHDGFSNNMLYTISIPEGVVANADDVANKAFEFSFTSIKAAPDFVALNPADGEKAVELDEALSVQFDQDITEIDLPGISIIDENGEELSEITTSISDRILTITHPAFENHTSYTATIPAGSVQNTDGVGNGRFEWSFRSVMKAPSILTLSPGADVDQVSIDHPILITFDQALSEGKLSGVTIFDGAGSSISYIAEIVEDSSISISHDGLENMTTYTVIIPSETVLNEDSVGNPEIQWSFTTIVSVPGEVVLSSPKKGEGSVELNPELTWISAERAETYSVEISSDSLFTDNILITKSGISGTKIKMIDDLGYYQNYYWRVRALNDGGNGEWSDVARFTTKAETPEQLFPVAGAEKISTAPNVQWLSDYNQTEFNLQLSTSETFETMVFDTMATDAEVMLSGLKANESYFWKVRILDQETTSDWSSVWNFTTRPDPEDEEDEPIDVNITFGETSSGKGGEDGGETKEKPGSVDVKDYQLVSLPGTDQIRLDEFFEGEYNKEWRAFIETGRTVEFYDEYTPEDDRFVFTPGMGFWVLSKKIVAGEYLFTPVATNENDAFGIPVHDGWNIIGNPYQSNVEWKLVQELNTITSSIYGYDQQFVEVDTMKVLGGYYFYNNPELNMDTLFIPYTGFEQRGIEADSTAGSSKGFPKLLVQASLGKKLNTGIEIVYSDSAEQHQVGLTKYHPGVERASYGMVMNKDGDDNNEHKIKRGVSTYNPEGELYHLQIKSEVGSRIKMNTMFENMPENARILLVNSVTHEAQMLTSGEDHEVLTSEPISRFKLYVGDKAALQEIEDALLPDQVELRPNYPNPFNPSTTINYALTENVDVRIVVYDILGRKVATLINEHQKAGWHKVRFDGSRLASGVYLYRLKAGNTMRLGKMTLIK